MQSPLACRAVAALFSALSIHALHAQSLPSNVSFTSAGSFANPALESVNSLTMIDNNLVNGYHTGFDLKDVPVHLNPIGPAGGAAFQWGVAHASSVYAHTSALIFEPLAVTNAAPEKHFKIGTLFYRNGTITTNTGATWVDLAMRLTFSQPLGLDPIDVTFGANLINTLNTDDPVASADIVSLHSPAAPLNFKDAFGNQYFLELNFQVDLDETDGTLSTAQQFRVFEGSGGSASLIGRFTTTPAFAPIPEPSVMALLGLATVTFAFRRKKMAH